MQRRPAEARCRLVTGVPAWKRKVGKGSRAPWVTCMSVLWIYRQHFSHTISCRWCMSVLWLYRQHFSHTISCRCTTHPCHAAYRTCLLDPLTWTQLSDAVTQAAVPSCFESIWRYGGLRWRESLQESLGQDRNSYQSRLPVPSEVGHSTGHRPIWKHRKFQGNGLRNAFRVPTGVPHVFYMRSSLPLGIPPGPGQMGMVPAEWSVRCMFPDPPLIDGWHMPGTHPVSQLDALLRCNLHVDLRLPEKPHWAGDGNEERFREGVGRHLAGRCGWRPQDSLGGVCSDECPANARQRKPNLQETCTEAAGCSGWEEGAAETEWFHAACEEAGRCYAESSEGRAEAPRGFPGHVETAGCVQCPQTSS